MKTEKKSNLTKTLVQYRAKDCLSWRERNWKSVHRIPGNDPGEFDEFTCSWNSHYSPKLTAGLIRRVSEDANDGSPAELSMLYRGMLEKEPVAAAHLQTRIMAVLASDWSICGQDPIHVREITGILQKAGIHSLIRHLLDALAFGYAGAAILWEEGGGAISGFRKVYAPNWIFDSAGNPALVTFSGQPKALSEYHPCQFVFHTHKLQSGPCQRGGLLRPLLWLHFFKHYAMRDRARYLEKYGIPFLIAKIRDEDFENESTRSSILSSLTKVGTDGAGVVTSGSELEILAPPSGTSDFQEWLEYIDRLYALLILGQTASSADARGLSAGHIQENVRRDILESDCRAIMDTIDTQILAPLEQFRYGTTDTLHFQMDFMAPEDLSEKASVVKILSESGYQVSREWLEKTFNIQLASGGK